MVVYDEIKAAVEKEFVEAKVLVEELLSADERCRNDDLWLIMQYWIHKQHIQLFVPFERLHEMTSAETITRVRREIQNRDMKFLPTDPEVLIKRKVKQSVLHDYYSGTRPDIVNAVIMKRYAVK